MTDLFWITDYLAIGHKQQAGSLKQSGMDCIIDLNGDPREAEDAKRAAIEYHPVLLTDETRDDDWVIGLDKISRIIHTAKNDGKKIYLHCTQGQGRSPTAAMAYLIDNSVSLDNAVELVRSKNPRTWSSGNPVGKYRRILERYDKLKHKTAPSALASV